MATTNPKVSLLTIALIVFALLTFILTITSYLFFKQRTDEQAKSQVAE
jgi:membrane protein implicated in regulation of membrane protease activity